FFHPSSNIFSVKKKGILLCKSSSKSPRRKDE
ncbi:unnamed protein product, partial [Larinioides sclopetarius]